MTVCIQPNDTIALACPASQCDNENQVLQTKAYLRKNYHLNACYHKETYQACSKKIRADIFCDYLFNPDIKLIWALRGGEGSADLIPLIHQQQHKIQQLNPKLLMGFSDITALLLYFSQQYNWPVIHGFNARQLALKTIAPKSEKLTFDLLFNLDKNYSLELESFNAVAEKIQSFEHLLIGGNLSLINISIHDIWEIQANNKILFLEDVHEKPHAVLRTLKYFTRIGLFKFVKGIILGQFMNPRLEKSVDLTMQFALKEWAKAMNRPVWHTLQISHGRNNIPIPFNRPMHLKII